MDFETTSGVVEDLIETLEDGRKGFDQAATQVADGGNAQLASRLRELSSQRARFSAQLREWAGSNGLEIREEGSIGGAMHRGWIALKDALTSDSGAAVIGAVQTGEEHANQEYVDALEKELEPSLRTIVESQHAAVTESLNHMKSMAAG